MKNRFGLIIFDTMQGMKKLFVFAAVLFAFFSNTVEAQSKKVIADKIVGQVGDKAIGLMSISTEIDYTLLNQYF